MVRFDLKKHPYRKNKVSRSGRRKGRISDPLYTKPRVAIVKLDPEQAILTSCRLGNTSAFMEAASSCVMGIGACPGGHHCNTGVRGTQGLAHCFVELRERPS